MYLYRAVDKYGDTIDFLLRAHRDTIAAKAFFRKAFAQHDRLDKVTLDGSTSNKATLEEANEGVSKEEEIEIRQVKYLKNHAEQDHRFIKKRIRPMLGFKSFHSARLTLSGIENIKMIQKGQIIGQQKNNAAFKNFVNLMVWCVKNLLFTQTKVNHYKLM